MTLPWRDMQDNMNDTSPLNSTVISDVRTSEIQKRKDLPILSKLDCICRSPPEVRLVPESSF